MNWLDLILVTIVVASFAGGIAKGFARAAIGLGATLVGLLCGLWFYGLVAHYFQPYVSSKGVASFLGFLVIFIGIAVAGGLLAALLAKMFDIAGFSWLDRLLGGAFGILRGVVVCIGLIMIMLAFDPKPPTDSVAGSRFAPYVGRASEVLSKVTPHEVKIAFARSYERVKQIWKDTVGAEERIKLPVERI